MPFHYKYCMWLPQIFGLKFKNSMCICVCVCVNHVWKSLGTHWPSTYLAMVCVRVWTLLGRFQGSCLTWRRNFLVQFTLGSISCWNSDRNTRRHTQRIRPYESVSTVRQILHRKKGDLYDKLPLSTSCISIFFLSLSSSSFSLSLKSTLFSDVYWHHKTSVTLLKQLEHIKLFQSTTQLNHLGG